MAGKCGPKRSGFATGTWLLAILTTVPNVGCAETGELDSILVLWSDPSRLLEYGYEDMRREVRVIFREIGVRVHCQRAADIDGESDNEENGSSSPAGLGTRSVRAVLMPIEPVDWELSHHVNGVTVGEPGRSKRTIFIFFPRVLRSLQQRRAPGRVPSMREIKELARALGRVLAHEVVHAIAPDAPHRDDGLMARVLTRYPLIQPRLSMSESTRESLVAHLRARSVRRLERMPLDSGEKRR